MIPLITELDEPITKVYGYFKSYLEKLVSIHDFIPWKITESMGYDVVWSYEYIISSETISWSARKDVDKLVLKHSTWGLQLLYVLWRR